MRLGWLQDPETDVPGGAELSCRELLRHVPDGIEVASMPPGQVGEADEYAVFNCTAYGMDVIGKMRGKPIVKFCYDVWLHGDARVRDWLLREARVVVFQSPLHREHFGWPVHAPEDIMPPALDLHPFRALPTQGRRMEDTPRSGTLWLGRIHPLKGIAAAVAWARANGPVDFYGGGMELADGPNVTYCGQVSPEAVPDLMAFYERFLFLPEEIEPFSRTTAEAWAAGLELEVNDRVGFRWWLDNAPDQIEDGARAFWALFG